MKGARAGSHYDLAFVGGGLASGLAAYRLRQRRPDLSVALFEAAPELGGNHTWSFHQGDLTLAEHAWLKPFVVHKWPSYEVLFPERRRVLETGYAGVTSERFRAVVTAALGDAIHTGAPVAGFDRTSVTLADGKAVSAGCVIDARGRAPGLHLDLGFQKFLGREIRLMAPHGLARPIVMDATVPQEGGYRFIYVLPFTKDTLLVEDTYYADGPALYDRRLRALIDNYLRSRGWQTESVLREEHGALPIALGGDMNAFWAEKDGQPAIGLAAALFHPTTGYSLPDAVHMADLLAAQPDFSPDALFAAIRSHAVRTWRERGFYRMLNRMLFRAGAPSERYKVLQHFYRLPEPLVARFYAARLTPADKLRILSGKPPVSVLGALRAVAGRRARLEHT